MPGVMIGYKPEFSNNSALGDTYSTLYVRVSC
jgi:hypothetical protein